MKSTETPYFLPSNYGRKYGGSLRDMLSSLLIATVPLPVYALQRFACGPALRRSRGDAIFPGTPWHYGRP